MKWGDYRWYSFNLYISPHPELRYDRPLEEERSTSTTLSWTAMQKLNPGQYFNDDIVEVATKWVLAWILGLPSAEYLFWIQLQVHTWEKHVKQILPWRARYTSGAVSFLPTSESEICCMIVHPILINENSKGWNTVLKWIKPEILSKKYWIIPVHDKMRSVNGSQRDAS